MHMKEQGIRAAAAAALGALCAYGVQMFVPLVVLVAAMMLDYATGLARPYSARGAEQPASASGESSRSWAIS